MKTAVTERDNHQCFYNLVTILGSKSQAEYRSQFVCNACSRITMAYLYSSTLGDLSVSVGSVFTKPHTSIPKALHPLATTGSRITVFKRACRVHYWHRGKEMVADCLVRLFWRPSRDIFYLFCLWCPCRECRWRGSSADESYTLSHPVPPQTCNRSSVSWTAFYQRSA